MKKNNWRGHWIISPDFLGRQPINVFHKEMDSGQEKGHDEALKNYHMLVRKSFEVSKTCKQALLRISADDYYKVYINGQFIGQGPSPAYHFQYHYNQYELDDVLIAGRNTIAIHVYYQGLINRVWNSGDYRQGMIAEIVADDEVLAASDASWLYSRAEEYSGEPVIGYETQFTENIDSRLKKDGWYLPNYDDQTWLPTAVNLANDYHLVLQPTANLAVYTLKPESVEWVEQGYYLIDFGHEITGTFTARAFGEAGEILTLIHGEELEASDHQRVKYPMRCGCPYKEDWILSGRQDILEQFDYKAFRYVMVIGRRDSVDLDSFAAVVRHYPMEEDRCRFTSANPLLNKIWDICQAGVKWGSQEVFTDCPSREKGQYLGDATIAAQAHLYLTGDLRLFRQCLNMFAQSARICSGLMAVAPGSFMQEIADFSLQWPYQLLVYYKQSGDLEFLKEMYPFAEGILDYFSRYQRTDGLLESVKEKWNLVDWPENLRDNYDFELSRPVGDGCHNVINAFFCGAVGVVDEIKAILEIPCNGRYGALKQAYLEVFYDTQKKLFRDAPDSKHYSLHSNIQPLFWGLVPDDAITSVVSLLAEKRLACGVYNAYFLLKGLARVGEYDLLYELLIAEDERSWANMIREGATTCFEAWGKEQKWNTSLCHPWASAPIVVLIEDIAGLYPATPGWQEIGFRPHIPEHLENLELVITTPVGRVTVKKEFGQTKLFQS